LRKESGFDFADWIRLYVSATPGLEESLQAQREYIMAETRANELSSKPSPDDAAVKQVGIEVETATIGIARG
ncbi:MAG TPA: DUF5915 domain-containing protein, partial [Anaerolineales bacterium]